jgi:hypothetical protein
MGWVVNATPRPPLPRETPGIDCTGGWVGLGAGLDRYGNLAPTGIRSPDLRARSESLYRLCHPRNLKLLDSYLPWLYLKVVSILSEFIHTFPLLPICNKAKSVAPLPKEFLLPQKARNFFNSRAAQERWWLIALNFCCCCMLLVYVASV